MQTPEEKFKELDNLVRKLRKECPWDRAQTNDSIKAATIEEAYEVTEAIDNKDYNELRTELGDLLLHVLFHTIIAEEEGHFTIKEVIDGLIKKLIRRHPHIFSDQKLENPEEVKRNWEKLKMLEGRESALDGLPGNLPSLIKANRIQEKAAKIGFEWIDAEDAYKKVIEETEEIKRESENLNTEKLEEEIGDLLFAITNYARIKGINSDNALRIANRKFTMRFGYVEKAAKERNITMCSANLPELLKLWSEAKNQKF